jgi:uncharacterized protein YcfJ
MKKILIALGSVMLGLLLGGCVQVEVPASQTVAVLPPRPGVPAMAAPKKSTEAFQQDRDACIRDAGDVVAGEVEAANRRAIGTSAMGTAIGAGLGAALGAASGSTGIGAVIGAATGTPIGTSIAAEAADDSQYELQQRYDWAYAQCMQAKGNQVPGFSPPSVSPPSG